MSWVFLAWANGLLSAANIAFWAAGHSTTGWNAFMGGVTFACCVDSIIMAIKARRHD